MKKRKTRRDITLEFLTRASVEGAIRITSRQIATRLKEEKGITGLNGKPLTASAINQQLDLLEQEGKIRREGGQGKSNQIIYIL